MVVACQSQARADDYLLDLTVWKVEVKDGAAPLGLLAPVWSTRPKTWLA